MRSIHVRWTLAALCLAAPVAAQSWSAQDLRDRVTALQEAGSGLHLAVVTDLLSNRDAAFSALCAMIQGDHREYLLKIERLLDQLADDRWAVREDAERQLVEVGARALSLIDERRVSGETLEERVRSARIEDQIHARGTAEEEAEIRVLRGLVAGAAYFQSSERLANALVSATGHTDPLVVEGALRALGHVGTAADHAPFLANRLRALESVDRLSRRTVLGALASLSGQAAIDVLTEIVAEGALDQSERLGLILDLRARPDGAALLQTLQGDPDPAVAAAASIELAAPAATGGAAAQIVLANRDTLPGELAAIRSDHVEVRLTEANAEPGVVRVPLDQCGAITFAREPAAGDADAVRVFTSQGSLVSGRLVAVDANTVTIHSEVFGEVVFERSHVQGIAVDRTIDRLVGASDRFDRVRNPAGELIDGSIKLVAGGVVEIETDGAARRIDLSEVAGLLFKRPPPGSQREGGSFTRIDLATGDKLLSHLGAFDGTQFGISVPGIGTAALPVTDVARIEFGVGGGALWGFTLVADYSENQIFELDDQNKKGFVLDEMYGVWDAECLDNGNLLVVEFALGRVMEIRRDRTEVWSFDDLKNPYDADRLPNGNTLIADTYGLRVIEVSPAGEIVWEYGQNAKPLDVERLANGNTLIADGNGDRVIEVNPAGEVVWELTEMEGVWDVDRLANGNTLITQRRSGHRVIEVDRDGNVVFEIKNLVSPSDADRLPNGHTIVAEDGKIREFDRFGNVVWEQTVSWAVEVNRY